MHAAAAEWQSGAHQADQGWTPHRRPSACTLGALGADTPGAEEVSVSTPSRRQGCRDLPAPSMRCQSA